LTRERIDQDLSAGNRGYLTGQAPQADEGSRSATRTTQVVEVELRSPLKFETRRKPAPETAPVPAGAGETAAIAAPVEEASSEITVATNFQKYTVKKNDTLQKISKKFFGTTNRWLLIYEANRDVLKSPDKVVPGQVLNIPANIQSKTKRHQLKEPAENLK
jgi:nucleoid-associated protein YgaU